MPKFIIKTDEPSNLIEINLPEGTYRTVGVFFEDDEGQEHPLVWVDNFYSKLNVDEDDDVVQYWDATVYMHLGANDPSGNVFYFNADGSESGE